MKKNLFIKILSAFLISVVLMFGLASCQHESVPNVTCTYDGEILKWTDVSSATKYEVKVNDERSKITDKSELKYDAEEELTTVTIKPLDKDDKNLYTSDISFEFKRLSVFDTPTYNHGIISWKEVSNAVYYLVKIGDQQPKKCYETEYELDPGINNDVCVKPVLDVSKVSDGRYYSYSIPQTYEIIDTPRIISFDKETRTITWEPVEKVGGYYINIELDGKNVKQSSIGADSTYYNGYSFANAGGYTVKLSATKNGNSNSYDSKYYEQKIIRLAAPKNFKTEDSNGSIYLSWDSVDYATKYKIALPSGNFAETKDTFYKYIPESKASETNYNFKIYAQSNDAYTLDSTDYASEDVVKLGMVKNIKIQGDMITWDLVDKAQGYVISVDGTEVNTDRNQYAFEGYDGSHKIKIKAKGNGSNIVSSDYSEIQTIYKLSKPKNLSINNGVLSWDPVSNASSYRIILTNGNSDSSDGSYTSTSNTITINKSDLKESKTIQVQAIGDGLTKVDSKLSDPYNTFVLNAPVVSVTTEGIVWTKVDKATSYTVKIGNYKKVVTGTALNLSEDDIPAGTYAVTVIANGDSIHYFESEESKAISVKLLSKPNISENEQLTGISWKTVTSAADYEIRIDNGTIIQTGSASRNYDITFTTSGIHTVSLRAVGDGVNSVTSGWNTMQINVEAVQAPTGFSVSKNGQKLTITANEVAGASGYKFKIGGVIYKSETNSYDYIINNPGDYVIAVAATGNGFKSIDSNFTSEETFTVLNGPSGATFTKEDDETYLLTWKPVNKAFSYTVELTKTFNDKTTQITNVDLTSPELVIDVNDVLTISVKITANGNNIDTFSSEPVIVSAPSIN